MGYQMITGGQRPDHATIARFQPALGRLVSQVLWVLATAGIVALGMVIVDGASGAALRA